MPVDITLQEAKNIRKWVEEGKDKLITAGLG